MQEDLFSILTRWRIHIFPLCADIKQMYRHIWMDPEDCDFQRIVWRANPEETIKHYKLLSVTYGEASAPFQAVRTLYQLATDLEETYPLAAPIVRRDFYMDDVLTGESTVARAIALQSELMGMMKEANFTLRKWSSSYSEVLKALPEEMRETSLPLRFDEDDSIKTLGLFWNPATDEFKFTVEPLSLQPVTKRSVLSQIAKVFDPLGLISPVTVRGKILMQILWKLQLGWDEKIDEGMTRSWLSYCKELCSVANLRIPRCVTTNAATSYHLHGFSDASEKAYAAAVYLLTTTKSGKTHSNLVCSKTKIAPSKQISLPRLELGGALLLSRLVSSVVTALPVTLTEIHGWTDSMVVKYWLNSPPNGGELLLQIE
ncbi:unnamed protein product [Allacma fusca]|uniref:Gag-pol polyprotein n=1 Tax=Allacma fusca TaxID=39272 RepID=A0A8J2KZM4_9HEXA|nr:unnamed protein product [Allacma fusca]